MCAFALLFESHKQIVQFSRFFFLDHLSFIVFRFQGTKLNKSDAWILSFFFPFLVNWVKSCSPS